MYFWDEVLKERDEIDTLAGINETIDNYNYNDNIEKTACPRVLGKALLSSGLND